MLNQYSEASPQAHFVSNQHDSWFDSKPQRSLDIMHTMTFSESRWKITNVCVCVFLCVFSSNPKFQKIITQINDMKHVISRIFCASEQQNHFDDNQE